MYSNLLDNTLLSDGKWIYPALLYFIQNLLTYSTYFEHKTRVYSYSHIYIYNCVFRSIFNNNIQRKL